MSEIDIPLSVLFRLCKSKTHGKCPVKGCRRSSRKDGKLCGTHHVFAWRSRNPMRAAYSTLRDHAKEKRRTFTITFEEFKLLCHATGYDKDKGQSPSNLSIDRIDNKRGYEIDNIRVVTVAINSQKGNHEKKIKLANGTIPWEIIDITQYIEDEKKRSDKYDPRNKFQPIDAGEVDPDNCPF